MAVNQLAQLLAEYENADLAVPGEVFPAPERDLNSILSIAGARLNDKLEGGISGLLNAVMAPGAALQGEYNQRPIFEDGSVGQFDPRMIEDAASLSGLVSLGSAPIPRPSGSIGMGARVTSDAAPDNFPIRANEPFPYMHNTEGAFNNVPRGSDATRLDPSGRFVIHGEGGVAPDSRWISGEMEFSNPLVVQWDGWKERLSNAYEGATGARLTELLKRDGYDGIVTFDNYGPSEIVDLR